MLGLRGEPGLAGADLTRINLYEAELQFTPLRAATSARADVALAELAGADLEDADVRAARGGPQVNGLDQARNRDRARLAAP
ncbi:MAG: pentapeptide repeat-containing protein [Gemmatimonadales bacterium]|nr:pentapeptide repeat-containing protein [Gemmatimonadales bacterium]